MKKRFVSLLLAISMVLTLCPASAFAEVYTGGGIFNYKVSAQELDVQNSGTGIGPGSDLGINSQGIPYNTNTDSDNQNSSDAACSGTGWSYGVNNLFTSDSEQYNKNVLTLSSGLYNFSSLGNVKVPVLLSTSTDSNSTPATIAGGTFDENVYLQSLLLNDYSSYGTNNYIVGGTFNAPVQSGFRSETSGSYILGGVFNSTIDMGYGEVWGGIVTSSTYTSSSNTNCLVSVSGAQLWSSYQITGGDVSKVTISVKTPSELPGTYGLSNRISTSYTLSSTPSISVRLRNNTDYDPQVELETNGTFTNINYQTTYDGKTVSGQKLTFSPNGSDTAFKLSEDLILNAESPILTLPSYITELKVDNTSVTLTTSKVSVAAGKKVEFTVNPADAKIKFEEGTAPDDLTQDTTTGLCSFTMPNNSLTARQYNKLHINQSGNPITNNTYISNNYYYGDGWNRFMYTDPTLAITADQNLTAETNAVKMPVNIGVENEASVTVTGGTFTRKVTLTNGTLKNATIKPFYSSNSLSSTANGIFEDCTFVLTGNTLTNNGTIRSTANGKTVISGGNVTNNGTIAVRDSVIEAKVTNSGTISSGIFTGEVTNSGTIDATASDAPVLIYGTLTNTGTATTVYTLTAPTDCTVLPENYSGSTQLNFNGKVYVSGKAKLTVTAPDSITYPDWTATGYTLTTTQQRARTITIDMPAKDVVLTVAEGTAPAQPFTPDASNFDYTAPTGLTDKNTADEVNNAVRGALTAKNGVDMSDVEVIYIDSEGNPLSGAPTTAGDYTFKLKVAAKDGVYTAAEVENPGVWKFSIASTAVDPGEPSEPTDPSNPNEPTTPEEPETPAEPTQPADSTGEGAALVLGTVAVGGAAYLLGTQIWLEANLPGGVIPTSREQLAVLLWQQAGKPEPAPAALYTDMAAADTDGQQAARWCVQQGLMQDFAEGTCFKPGLYVFRPQVIKAWNDLQQLQNP